MRFYWKEIHNMMSELFDEEKLYEAYNRASNKEAIEKGKAERDRELAEKMRADGVDEEFIRKYLGV